MSLDAAAVLFTNEADFLAAAGATELESFESVPVTGFPVTVSLRPRRIF